MPSMSERPVVLFDGNCQGQMLAAVFSSTGTAEAYFVGGDLGFVPSYRRQACNYVTEQTALEIIHQTRLQGRRVFQATQATPMSDGAITLYSDLVDNVIRYPHIQFFAQSPIEFEAKFGKKRTPAKILTIDISTIKVCQTRAVSEVDFSGFIEANGRTRPLFHTPLHPGGELTAMLYADLAEKLCARNQSLVAHVCEVLKSGEGINFTTNHPISNEILYNLGYDWGIDYSKYSCALEFARLGQWRQLLDEHRNLLTTFPRETQILFALCKAAIHEKESGLAYYLLDELLDLSPGYIHHWLTAFTFYRNQDDESSVVGGVERAKRFFGDQRQLSQILAYLLIERQMWSDAEYYARDYHSKTPDRFDSLVPVLKIFAYTNRIEEARHWGRLSALSCPVSRVNELRANLSNVPEIDWTFLDREHVFSAEAGNG